MYRRNSLFIIGLLGLFSFSSSAQCGSNYDEQVQKLSLQRINYLTAKIELYLLEVRRLGCGITLPKASRNTRLSMLASEALCYDDLYRYKEQLISATEPDILVIYEGDNDIVHLEEDGSQRKIFNILSDARQLFELDPANPPRASRVSSFTKPSPARWNHLAKYKAVNSLLEELADGYNYHFMDCWPWLTDNNGQVDSALFIFDKLHLNDKGNHLLGLHMAEEIGDSYGRRTIT